MKNLSSVFKAKTVTGGIKAHFGVVISLLLIYALYVNFSFDKSNVSTTEQILFWVFSSLLIIIPLIMFFSLSNYFKEALNKINCLVSQVAKGSFENRITNITQRDELGAISWALNSMTDQVEALIKELDTSIKYASEGKFFRKPFTSGLHGALTIVAKEVNKSLTHQEKVVIANEEQKKYLERNTQKLLVKMDKFSNGDLTVSITPEHDSDAIGRLLHAFNDSVLNMNKMMHSVMDAVQATASAANQISSSAEELAAASQEQSAQTSEVAAAVEQMAATITETSRNVVLTNDAAKRSGEVANEGQEIIKETINGMKIIEEVVNHSSDIILELGESSGQIGEIIQVINDIADQTNLLALNAAIEAARAGEHGRGFSVVADEVRKLSERTTSATNEIKEKVSKIQQDSNNANEAIKQGNDEVAKGMMEVTRAGNSMAEIVRSSNDVLDVSTQVAAASEEQSAAVEQISKSINGINSVAYESATAVQQVAGAATDLSQLAENLQNLVTQFKIDQSNESYSIKSDGTLINNKSNENGSINNNGLFEGVRES